MQGLVNAFDMPARQAFLLTMVENKADLGNAIALNSSMVNLARLVGPSIAGVVIAATSEGWCFLIDGVSYVAVIVALLRMRIAPRRRAGGARSALQQFTRRVRVRVRVSADPLDHPAARAREPGRRALLRADAGVRDDGLPRRSAHAGSADDGVGLRRAARRALAARRAIGVGLGRVIPMASALFGAGLIAFRSRTCSGSRFPCLTVAGFGFMVQMASSNTVIQTIVDDEKRGRVMSFYMMAFLGTAPFGSLIAGSLSHAIGAAHTLLLGGSAASPARCGSRAPFRRSAQAVRPIYVRLGILPEVTPGIANAAELSVPPE